MLNTIIKGKRQQPPRILIYGSEGIGKSNLGAGAPKPIFVPTEDGLDQIDCDSFPLCKEYGDVIAALRSLKTEAHEYKTVVIDTLDWLEKLIWAQVCKQYGVKTLDKVDGGFGKRHTVRSL